MRTAAAPWVLIALLAGACENTESTITPTRTAPDDDSAPDDDIEPHGTGTIAVTSGFLSTLTDGQFPNAKLVLFPATYVHETHDDGERYFWQLDDHAASACQFGKSSTAASPPDMAGVLIIDAAYPAMDDPCAYLVPTADMQTGIVPPIHITVDARGYVAGIHAQDTGGVRFIGSSEFIAVPIDGIVTISLRVGRDVAGYWRQTAGDMLISDAFPVHMGPQGKTTEPGELAPCTYAVWSLGWPAVDALCHLGGERVWHHRMLRDGTMIIVDGAFRDGGTTLEYTVNDETGVLSPGPYIFTRIE
ncbi:MAG: hypothetical protein Q7T01_01245 [bacterium]|nr:hypothetical protein [bacterium]